jgi:acetate kinase
MAQPVLVINCGSSSIKFGLFARAEQKKPMLTALAERLGDSTPRLVIHGDPEIEHNLPDGADHRAAMQAFMQAAAHVLHDLQGIGHRVVHGGEIFHDSVLLNDSAIANLDSLSSLAPLHNPLNMLGIHLCHELFPDTPQVAVFDTSFHQSMDPRVYLYATPWQWYEQAGVRRYGFHGTSYRYVAMEAAHRLKRPLSDCNLLITHLGNGCSACAVRSGQSVDTSMGLTPMDGLVMGTRSGAVDPGLHDHMHRHDGLSLDQVMTDLNRHSGLLGLSGLSNDMRTLLEAEADGHAGATRAIEVFCFRAARELAGLSCSLPNIDAVVFTGGIGEHSAVIRQRILAQWRNIPYQLNDDLNTRHGDEPGRISEPGSPLVLVIATNEESMIARDTFRIVHSSQESV